MKNIHEVISDPYLRQLYGFLFNQQNNWILIFINFIGLKFPK